MPWMKSPLPTIAVLYVADSLEAGRGHMTLVPTDQKLPPTPDLELGACDPMKRSIEPILRQVWAAGQWEKCGDTIQDTRWDAAAAGKDALSANVW